MSKEQFVTILLKIFWIVTLVCGLTLAAPIVPAHAASIIVNDLADNATGGDGACTLREAINNANSDSDTTSGDCAAGGGADVITFGVSGTILLNASLPSITDADELTVDGTGQSITISGNTTWRVFKVDSGANAVLRELTVQYGYGGSGGSGGGISNAGTLSLQHLTVSNNHALSAGGGIYNNTGTLNISHSTITANTAQVGGGGIVSFSGNVTLNDSLVTGNSNHAIVNQGGTFTINRTTISGNTASYGAGIVNYPNYAGTVILNYSTLVNNTATTGAGIFNADTMIVTNSTFANNQADTGGAIFQNSGSLSVLNSTFSGNGATTSGGAIYQYGGSATVQNTVLANSTSDGNCFGTITNGGNNIDDGTTCGFGSSYGSLSSTNPQLAALGSYGGGTLTFALQPNSPAIDAVIWNAPNNCPGQDQRGATRPTDSNGDGTASCDIGAFELGGLQCGIQAASEPADYAFLGNVLLRVTDDGTNLDCLRLTGIPSDHPNATPPLMTGEYWQILGLQDDRSTSAAPDFLVNLTLPANSFVPDEDDKVCRWNPGGPGLQWDCAMSAYDATSITRNGISAFSEWAAGNNAGPTAVVVWAFGGHAGQDRVLSYGLLALGGLVVTGLSGICLRRAMAHRGR